jgi:hypothetical protein
MLSEQYGLKPFAIHFPVTPALRPGDETLITIAPACRPIEAGFNPGSRILAGE